MDVTKRSGRRKRLIVLGVTAIVVCICGRVVSRYTTRPFNGIDVEQLDADLRASLSAGSTVEEGRAWFARHGITPTESERYLDFEQYASVPNSSLLDTAEIDISLRYDSDRRLRSAHVSRNVRSP